MKSDSFRATRAARTTADERWQSLVTRDTDADGRFFYSVETTGIYCRPSCGARLARPEHVAFHASAEAAELAGFRACKRCRPDESSGQAFLQSLVLKAIAIIEAAEMPPGLAALAADVGLSPSHFHRVFKQATGVTPKQYGAARRDQRLRQKLARCESVTEAIFDAGFGANSRFYEKADSVLGMTASTFRAGGDGALIRFAVGQCSLGAILVAQSARGICAILVGDDPEDLVRDLQDRFPRADLAGGDAGYEAVVAKVIGLVDMPQIGLDLPLDIRGTAFQQRVWQALRDIPSGETVTYSDIARRIGAPAAARAVASACGANALAVAIPCHRVLRTDGTLSGYRWGIDRKRALLEAEASALVKQKNPL